MPETITLPGLPSMVPLARRAVGALLEDSPRRGDAELIVSELATNAVLHSRSRDGQFTVTLDRKPGWVRLEVADGGPLPAEALFDAGDRGEFGRGLEVVDAFADRWGHQRDEASATYWAELDWAESQ